LYTNQNKQKMAFRTQKISQMTPKGADLEATDLIEVSTIESGSYVTRSITGQELIDAIPPTTIQWGDIGGTLSAQTDLNTALNAKQDDITLTTTGSSGASTFVGNTLNVPTYTLAGLGGVPTSRTLTINGTTQDLSANRTFTIPTDLTVGTTPIASGNVGRVLFQGTGNVLQQSSSLAYDDTTKAFSVIGNQNATTNISVVNTDTTNASSRARVSVTSGTIIGSMASIIGNDFYLGTESAHNVNFTTAGTTRFNIINSTGNLNIGTLASDIGARLGVRGSGSTSATKTLLVRNLANTDLLTIWDDGAIGVNTSTNAGFRLDVNGTARVQGNTTISLNQNNTTLLAISNTTAGTSSNASLQLTSDTSAGQAQVFKYSSTRTAYKTLAANDFGHYNATAGDISFLNDVPNGRIKFATNQSNTAQMTLFATGNLGINTTTDAGFRLDVDGSMRGTNGLRLTGGLLRADGLGGAGTAFTVVDDNGSFIRNSAWNYDRTTLNTWVNGTQQTSSVLTLNSTTKGFLPPRMTATQKNAIATPATGLQVYDTTLNRPCFYDGTTWITL
jgi:hypothetical protein